MGWAGLEPAEPGQGGWWVLMGLGGLMSSGVSSGEVPGAESCEDLPLGPNEGGGGATSEDWAG